MDDQLPLAAILLILICVALAILAVRKQRGPRAESTEDHSPSSSRSKIKSGDEVTSSRQTWKTVLLIIALLINAVLSYAVIDLYRREDRTKKETEAAVAAGNQEVARQVAMALTALPDTRDLELRVRKQEQTTRDQQTQLDEHARALTNLTAPGISSVDPNRIDIPLFCAGEVAVWGSSLVGGGIGC